MRSQSYDKRAILGTIGGIAFILFMSYGYYNQLLGISPMGSMIMQICFPMYMGLGLNLCIRSSLKFGNYFPMQNL